MKSYPFKRRTTPKRARMAGFTQPVLDTVMDHPVASMDRHFPPNAELPAQGAATVPPTRNEGLRIFR